MDVEYSSIQQNATDNDNRERCEKRKRIHDSSEPNEREVKKFCSDVQSMVISETPIVNPSNSSPDGFPANFPGNLFQTTNNSPSFSSNNTTLSSNYPTNLPSHFYNSGNYSSNNYSSTNNFHQTKAESLTIDSSMYMSSIIIFIRTLTGRMLEIEANPQDTVLGLKERIQMRDGIPPSNQRLVFQGKALSDSQILHSYVSIIFLRNIIFEEWEYPRPSIHYFFLVFRFF